MQTLLLVVHVLLATGLIALVLMQHGKGADAGAAFGSGASATVFGARGSGSFLSRATAILATLFFVVSMVLAILANRQAGHTSVTAVQPVTAPVTEKKKQPVSPSTDVPAAPAQPRSSDVPSAPVKGAAKQDKAAK